MIEQVESFRQEQCKKGIEVSFMLQYQQFGNQIFLGKIAGNKNGRYHKYRVCKKQQSANFSCPSLRDGSLSLLFVYSLSLTRFYLIRADDHLEHIVCVDDVFLKTT